MRKTSSARISAMIVAMVFTMVGLNTAWADIKPSWTTNLNSKVKWQRINALGQVFVSCKDGFCSLDPDTGKVLWHNKSLTNLDENRFREIANSPYVLVGTDEKDPDTILVDPDTGKKIFSSKSVGFIMIDKTVPLYKAGCILVSGKGSLTKMKTSAVMVDMVSGKTLWKMDNLEKITAVHEINAKEIVLTGVFTHYRVEAHSGRIIWQVASNELSTQLDRLGKFGGMMKNLSQNFVDPNSNDTVFFMHPNKTVFFIGYQNEADKEWNSGYTAYNLNDGSRVWKQDIRFEGRLGKVIFDDRGLMVFPDSDGASIINHYSYKDKKGMWGKRGRGTKVTGGVRQVVPTEQGILVYSGKKKNRFMNLIDPKTGGLKWKKPVKTAGELALVKQAECGLVYATDEEINIINTKSGQTLMKKGVSTGRGLYQLASGALYTWVPKEKAIYRIDLKTGQVGVFSNVPLKFKGGENPTDFEIRDNGFLVSSSQNIALFNKDGSLAFHKFYLAPPETNLKRALLFAQGTAAASAAALTGAYGVAAGAMSSGTVSSNGQVIATYHSEEAVNASNDLFAMSKASTKASVNSFKKFMQRYKATQETRDFMFVLTKEDHGNVLAKVSKIDGQIKEKINLGNKRKISYEVDVVTSKIFYRIQPKDIACYTFSRGDKMVTGQLSN